jgi:predicted nucleotidyltransferase
MTSLTVHGTPGATAASISRAHDLRHRADAAAMALASRWPGVSIRLFGSVARGQCHAHSDIDLALTGLPAQAALDAWLVAEAAAGTDAIDVLRMEECPPSLQAAIQAEGIPL